MTVNGTSITIDDTLEKHVELHVHLRGAMPVTCLLHLCKKTRPWQAAARVPETVREQMNTFPALRRFLALSEVQQHDIEDLLTFESLPQFLYSFFATSFFFREIDDFRLLVDSVLEDFHRQGIIYSEITVSLGEYLRQGLPMEQLLDVLAQAKKHSPVEVQWILDPVRNRGGKECLNLLQQVIDTGANPFTAITLGGAEDSFPLVDFIPLYRLSDTHGIRKTIHCGESGSPSDIDFAVKELLVERIGHGVRAIESSTTIDLLLDRNIHLEVCPTANIRCNLYPSIAAHPLAELLRLGVSLSLNTDDPSFFQTNLNREFSLLNDLGLPTTTRNALKKSAIRAAFVDPVEQKKLMTLLNN